MRRVLLLVLLVPLLAAPIMAAGPKQIESTCSTLETCIAELVAKAQGGNQPGEVLERRIVTYGDRAVEALIPLLMHPEMQVRDSAGVVIVDFRKVDPRHLSALVNAWRHGDTPGGQGSAGWMPRPIAATGTDEALRLLWEDFEREPNQSSNSQVFFALADFGSERIKPLLLNRFEQCRTDPTGESCDGLFALLRDIKERESAYPSWAVDAYVHLAETAASEGVREGAERILVGLHHPAGLPASQRRLAARTLPAKGDWSTAIDIKSEIGGIASYSLDARSSGPVIARFLAADDEDLRAKAALAIGQVGDTSSVPLLLRLEQELGDDWVLAYNVAESLGRLRAAEGVPLLRELAKDYWHGGVRNNAERALNAIATGTFGLPSVPGDPKPYVMTDESGDEYIYFGDLRYAGDNPSDRCGYPDKKVRFLRDPAGNIAWPRFADRELEFEPVDEETVREIRQRISPKEVRGRIMAVIPARDGTLVGFNAGEFGGGLYYLPKNGAAVRLSGEQVVYAWQMGGRVYVAAGLAHLVLDRGHLYVVDPRVPKIERVIRLPAEPTSISVAKARAVIVGTREGDIAIRSDGQLVDPAFLDDCAEQ